MKTLPLILAAGHLCLGFALASPAFAAISQTKIISQQAVAPLKPEQMAWANDLSHPVSRHTLCQPKGRHVFSAKTCSVLTQLSTYPTTEGQAIDIKRLKANRDMWLTLPMSVRERLETYDVLVIATVQPAAPFHLAR